VTRRQSVKPLIASVISSSALASPDDARPAIRLVALDVGGTIVEDRGDVPALLGKALKSRGIEFTPAEIAKLRGGSKRDIIRHFVEKQTLPAEANRDKVVERIYAEFTESLIAAYQTVPPVRGAAAAIEQLRSRGYLIATTTGFDRAVTASIFRRLGWESLFAAVICSDDVTQGRPAPYMLFHAMEAVRVQNVAQVVAVGDTPLDMQAGTNAGLRGVVGVLTGAATADQLSAEPHTQIVRSVADIPDLIASKF
jgi:phosphonatase-like hydrolase